MSRVQPHRQAQNPPVKYPDVTLRAAKNGREWVCPRADCNETFRLFNALEKHAASGECVNSTRLVTGQTESQAQQATQHIASKPQNSFDRQAVMQDVPHPEFGEPPRRRRKLAASSGGAHDSDRAVPSTSRDAVVTSGFKELSAFDRLRLRIPGALTAQQEADLQFVARRTYVDANGMAPEDNDDKRSVSIPDVGSSSTPQDSGAASAPGDVAAAMDRDEKESLAIDESFVMPDVVQSSSVSLQHVVTHPEQKGFQTTAAKHPTSTQRLSTKSPDSHPQPDSTFVRDFRSLSVTDEHAADPRPQPSTTPPPPEYPITPASLRSSPSPSPAPAPASAHRYQSLSYVTPPARAPPAHSSVLPSASLPSPPKPELAPAPALVPRPDPWPATLPPALKSFFATFEPMTHDIIDFAALGALFTEFGFITDHLLDAIAQHPAQGVWEEAEAAMATLGAMEWTCIMEALRARKRGLEARQEAKSD